MDSKFLQDAIFGGVTPNAVKLGTILTLGLFWVRTQRCHTVYRGQDGDMGYDTIQAVMDLDAGGVTVANQELPANTIWHFVRRQVSPCGLESTDSPALAIPIDSNGVLIPVTPNTPLDLQVEKASGGKLKVRWRYSRIGEETSPTGFRIYIDSGGGFDFGSPNVTVAYSLGRSGEFDWTSDALMDGQRYRFCLRSYATGLGESQNTDYVSAIADSGGPAAITPLVGNWESM